ncbi:unnamed protein product, partial [Rotaria socialis]
STADD